MKRSIRLTENDLHRVIKESVKRILSERIKSEEGMTDKEVVDRRMGNYLKDREQMLGDNPDVLDYQTEPEEGWYEYFNKQRKAKHNTTQNHNDVDEYQNFENNSSNDEMFNDAVEAIEMSDGLIDFYEWYPAFQDYVEPNEAEEVFNRALRKCGYLTENKLNRIIKECVKKVLSEEHRLQSSKLEDIIKQHGGIRKNTTWRVVIPYIKDEDIIGVYHANYKGMGKYNKVENYLEHEVIDRELKQSEDILDLELNDGNAVYFIFDNFRGKYDRIHKSVYDKKTKPWRGYKWQNVFAKDYFNDKDIRTKWYGWTPEKHREEMKFIKGMHKQNMNDLKNNRDEYLNNNW